MAVGGDVSYYQQMIDSITDYEVIRLDENDIVCSWHPGAEQLTGYTAAADEDLPPVVRGTALVRAARCLAALGRAGEAADAVRRAEPLLARWGGWRVAELVQVRERLGLVPADGRRAVTGTGALTRCGTGQPAVRPG